MITWHRAQLVYRYGAAAAAAVADAAYYYLHGAEREMLDGWMDMENVNALRAAAMNAPEQDDGRSANRSISSDFSSFHIHRPIHFPIDGDGCVLFAGGIFVLTSAL